MCYESAMCYIMPYYGIQVEWFNQSETEEDHPLFNATDSFTIPSRFSEALILSDSAGKPQSKQKLSLSQ